jgi:fructokinase
MTNAALPMNPNHIDVAGTGFAVLDRVYAKREKAFEALGGSCGNVLVSLAMLQRSVFPLLALGDDAIGNSLVDEFVRAGADTRYISRRYGMSSPVMAQWLDPDVGQHSFSFICPETEKELPRYCAVDELEVEEAKPALSACAVFYTDRLNSSTLRAMETAAESGSVIFFEPSAVENNNLFDRAINLSSIVKYSSDRLPDRVFARSLKVGAIVVVTLGADGLEVRQGGQRAWCPAIKAPVVRDTCGSGDMVSVGIIDWMLTHHKRGSEQPLLDDFLSGVVAGQRLAAINCAYAGARGIFRHHGANCARSILEGRIGDVAIQRDFFGF